MAKTGRPSKLTPELQERVCDLLKRGNYLETAALRTGIDRTTIRNWMRKGRSAKSGAYRDFFIAVEEASVYAETADMETIRKAAGVDWRAAAWRLEHRYPQRFKRTERHEVTGKRGAPLNAPSAVIYLPDNGRVPEGIEKKPRKGKG